MRMKFNKRVVTAVAVAAAAALNSAIAGNDLNPDSLELLPLPAPVEFKSDMDRPVTFDSSSVVTLDCPDASAADWLAKRFKEWYGKGAPAVVAGKCSLSVKNGDEAYAVEAGTQGVKIAARTIAGTRWAAYTIRQLAIAKRGTSTVEGHILPSLSISDAPRLQFRGMHLCWFPEVRFRQIERVVRLAALLKFNYVVIEPWGPWECRRNPWWGWPDTPMTKDVIKRLVAIGRDMGVTIVPQFNAFGHGSASRSCSLKHSVLDLHPERSVLFEPGGWNWCITNPEAQRTIREIIEEMYDDFGRPPFFHLGCDEAQPPGCPECRKVPYGELVCRHVSDIAAFVKTLGARPMIWHDMLLDKEDPRWQGFTKYGSKATCILADRLPRDMVICDWQYHAKGAEIGRWPTMEHFMEKGFSVVGCPWRNFSAMESMAAFLSERKCFGMLGTTWHHLRGDDFVNMFTGVSSAAWGTSPGCLQGTNGDTPQFNIRFGCALRMVGHDMKVSDYQDTGIVDFQIPPSWWIDN